VLSTTYAVLLEHTNDFIQTPVARNLKTFAVITRWANAQWSFAVQHSSHP